MKRIMKHDDQLHIRSMGKSIRVTAIFTDATEANDYMASHEEQACVAEFAPFVFLADKYDRGV